MTTDGRSTERRAVRVGDAELEIFLAEGPGVDRWVCAAHPAAVYGAETAALLAETAAASAVCVNPRGLGGSSPAARVAPEQMVDDLEALRGALGLPPWAFWGMSGGGWLAQLYARRHPGALSGIIVESACRCFRERLADPACALSPFFPAWREALLARGLLDEQSHREPGSAEDAEWLEVERLGQVLRWRGGPALLVAPMPLDAPMRRALPTLWSFDSRAWLASLRLPALVIAGSADPILPVAHAHAVHESISGSIFELADGGGHVPSTERRPGLWATIRGFVAEL